MRTEPHREQTRKSSAAHGVPAGPISILEIYRLDDAKRRLGWTDASLRSAKRRGLRLLTSGKRRYLTGREILRFLQHDTAANHPPPGGVAATPLTPSRQDT